MKLRDDGSVELTPVKSAADEALEKKLKTIGVVIARAVNKKRRDGLTPWPPRVSCWRKG